MERRGSIIVAAVSAGIIVAGGAATVAIVNASQAAPEPDTIALVVDPVAVTTPIASRPSFQPEPLPEIVFASPSATADPTEQAGVPASPQAEPEQSAKSGSISASRARSLVLAEAPGSVMSVGKTTRGGYAAYAVKVKRADGSTVTGYVTRVDGVIFDWTQTAAPAPAYEDDEYEEEEYEEEGDEDEDEDHEESEHEGSDHDEDDD